MENAVLNKISIADTFCKRFVGLMNKDKIAADEAMLFLNCSRIHTCFMKFDICVIYLDERFCIIDREVIKPWHFGKKVKQAKHVIETSDLNALRLPSKGRLLLKIEEVC